MKKTLTILSFFLLALTSQAVGFTWKSGAQVSFGDSLVSDLTPKTYTAYLVYLGSGSWGSTTIGESGLTLANTDKATGDTLTSLSGKTGALAKRNSQFSGSFDHAIGSTTSTGYTVAAGDYFGVYLSYTDGDGKTWYNLSSSVYRIPTTADDASALDDASFSFASTKTKVASGSSVSVGGGWTAVPEPSTAALALAGLALLLKRRKA